MYFVMLHIAECKLHGYQAVLNQYGFISFPTEAIQRNKVRLSLEEPAIEGGYKWWVWHAVSVVGEWYSLFRNGSQRDGLRYSVIEFI